MESKGVLFKELSEKEKLEIINQFKNINTDPNIHKYKFRKVLRGRFIISNAMLIPLKKSRMEL
jgi:hypothetical protein